MFLLLLPPSAFHHSSPPNLIRIDCHHHLQLWIMRKIIPYQINCTYIYESSCVSIDSRTMWLCIGFPKLCVSVLKGSIQKLSFCIHSVNFLVSFREFALSHHIIFNRVGGCPLKPRFRPSGKSKCGLIIEFVSIFRLVSSAAGWLTLWISYSESEIV